MIYIWYIYKILPGRKCQKTNLACCEKGDHVINKMVAVTSDKYSDGRDRENVITISPIMKLTLPGESRHLKTYM